MTNTKWLRRALLGGVALGVMATGAHADDLTKLKGELEALQSRVNQLEQQPAMAALPEGASFVTLNRGSAPIKTHLDRARLIDEDPDDRGFTIAITPSADLPAPVATLVISGFVKGDFIYSIDNDTGIALDMHALLSAASDSLANDHLRAHAHQSRWRIRSTTDTAIGQIRAMMEFDAPGAGYVPRMRHAFGEWDMTPNWTFLMGHTTSTAVLVPIGVPTVDWFSSAGTGGFPRVMQVRMTYHSGPISWAVAAEQPTRQTFVSWPNLAAYAQFDAPGGHQFIVTGNISDNARRTLTLFEEERPPIDEFDTFDDFLDWESDLPEFERRTRGGIGWTIGAGTNINLADIATLSLGAQYGENSDVCRFLNQAVGCGSGADGFNTFHPFGLDDAVFPGGVFADFYGDRGWGAQAGISFNVTDTTTFNVQYGYVSMDNLIRASDFDDVFRPARRVDTQTLHANILWQPVSQMRLGWEVMWGQVRAHGGSNELLVPTGEFDDDDEPTFDVFERSRRSKDTLRAQFGAWFFF